MTVDFYMYSPKHKVKAFVGNIGLSGIREYVGNEYIEFIRWVIEEHIDDVVVVNEHKLEELNPDYDFKELS